MKLYSVKSIFGPTIQGEGSHAGTPVKFLRFAGCNRWSGQEKDREKSVCWYCDTDFKSGTPMSAEQIIDGLEELKGPKVVVISGGEPTLQIDMALLSVIRSAGYQIHLETNGSRALGDMWGMFDHITMSPKQRRDETKLEECHDLKLLFPWVTALVTPDRFSDFSCVSRFIQPIWSEQYPQNLENAIEFLIENPGWRLSLQTHKIIGVD